MKTLSWLIAASLAVSTVSAAAILPPPADTEVERALPDQKIDAEAAPDADQKIFARLRGLYGAIDGLNTVTVKVDQGVVTLSGTLDSQENIAEAERLAIQVDGVVTVQNRLERDLSVEENLGAFTSLSEKFTDFVALLPLIFAALLVALLIGTVGYLIAGLRSFWAKVMPNVFLAELAASAIRFVFVTGGLIIALDMLGASALLGAVLGGAGVIGIALGFAMRDTVENYVASLMLSLRQPFRANDHVLIDNFEGRIIRLTSRATIMMTLDGNHLRIPNSTVFKAVILNYTTNPQRRFEFELGIDADDDPNAARHLGRETLKALPFVQNDPQPEARVMNVGDSNIVIQFLGWVDQSEVDWYKVRSRAIAAVKTKLEEAGFGLPEPIYRLRFDERTTPLRLENVPSAENKNSAESQPKPAKPVLLEVPDDGADVSADDGIAQMVENERAASDTGQDDLLDAQRPAE